MLPRRLAARHSRPRRAPEHGRLAGTGRGCHPTLVWTGGARVQSRPVRRLGKYLLIEPIASGGMAEVWRAEVAGPAGFVKQVAVKLVRADRGDDDEMVRMFIQEARLAGSLHHANIVHVFVVT